MLCIFNEIKDNLEGTAGVNLSQTGLNSQDDLGLGCFVGDNKGAAACVEVELLSLSVVLSTVRVDESIVKYLTRLEFVNSAYFFP